MCLCHMADSNVRQVKKTQQRQPPPSMSDDSTDDEQVPARLKTTEEEKRGTIPGSAEATAAALAGSRAQGNPSVGRSKKKRIVVRRQSIALQSPNPAQ